MSQTALVKMFARVSMETRQLLAAMNAQERSFLLRWGSYVRKTAKRSIKRYAPKVAADGKSIIGGSSKPGQPPRSRKGLLKNGIAYALSNGGMIAGPERIAGVVDNRAPRTLEYGGTSNFRQRKRKAYTVGQKGPLRIVGGRLAKGRSRVVYGTLATAAQVARAETIAQSLYGASTGKNVRIAERPFMRPAAAVANSKVERMLVK